MHMYQDTSHAQLFLVGNPSAPPLATKFLDKEAAQGARITSQCLLSHAQGHCVILQGE